MKDKPILFTPINARKIRANQKWQTRRVVKPQPTNTSDVWPKDDSCLTWDDIIAKTEYYVSCGLCPYGRPGDQLWVREACAIGFTDSDPLAVDYFADGERVVYEPITPEQHRAALGYINENRKSPIHMPKWAARTWLEITGVRVERIKDINLDDMRAEGVRPDNEASLLWRETLTQNFITLWNAINGKEYPWASNCWVWVIDFKRIEL